MALNETLHKLDTIAHSHGTVAVLGSMNADYTVTTPRLPGPGETVTGGPLTILPGGKSGNQAAAAALLGARVQMLGAVGSDSNAHFLLDKLQSAGVDTSAVLKTNGPSGTTVITVDAHGENTIVYSPGSNATVSPDYVAAHKRVIEQASALGLCLESPIEAVTAAARIAHAAGTRVLLNDSPFSATLPPELIKNSDILLVNEHEMAQLLGIDEPEDDDWHALDWGRLQEKFHHFGFDEAIVTLGAHGSIVLDRTSEEPIVSIRPVSVDAVDTTGCGDAYMGTILAGLASHLTLVESARLASYVSAYAATGHGAQASYGTTSQIQALFV
jgi:ribokinase